MKLTITFATSIALALGVVALCSAASYTVTDLGTLGGTTAGFAINASGQVTGLSYTTGDQIERAFLWTPTVPNGVSGTMHDLGTLYGSNSYGLGINAIGQVTGSADTTPGGTAPHAFLYDGTMHDLGTLGGSTSQGAAINDSGQVTGYAYSTGAVRAFLWTPTTPNGASGTMHDLGTLGGNSFGSGVNATGHVAGYSYTTGGVEHAFLYDGTMHDFALVGNAYRGVGIPNCAHSGESALTSEPLSLSATGRTSPSCASCGLHQLEDRRLKEPSIITD